MSSVTVAVKYAAAPSSHHMCVLDAAGCFGLDIGPKTAQLFSDAIQGCKTIFWNGPMGRFEVPGFATGTHAIARAMGQATGAGASTVVGGGLLCDTSQACSSCTCTLSSSMVGFDWRFVEVGCRRRDASSDRIRRVKRCRRWVAVVSRLPVYMYGQDKPTDTVG